MRYIGLSAYAIREFRNAGYGKRRIEYSYDAHDRSQSCCDPISGHVIHSLALGRRYAIRTAPAGFASSRREAQPDFGA